MSFNLSHIIKAIAAGFAATIVLTILMVIKKMMGIMPELDPVHMIANMVAQKMGIAPTMAIGWAMHFMIGTVVWGGAFSIFNGILPGSSQVKKGMSLGVAAWFLMMVGPMPMSGAGLFALNIGPMAPVMTLILHIIFGLALGMFFVKFGGNKLSANTDI